MNSESPQDACWRVKLKYGKITTPYKHFTVIAEGITGELSQGFSCRPGSAFMAMKDWASSVDEAVNMVEAVGKQIGFTLSGKIYTYKTEPSALPKEKPYGYDIQFTPFEL